MKTCSKCHEERSLAEFGKDRSRKDGLQVWCKGCQRQYRQANKEKLREANRSWKSANPEKVKASRDKRRARPEVKAARAAYDKKWKKDNPDKVREQARRSYQQHADERREAAREYAAQHPEKVKARQKKWRSKNKEKVRRYRKKNRHRDREYYARNKDEIRKNRELKRQWVVYEIRFADGTYYLGSSSHYDLRFNNHKSKARKGQHIEALNGKDFSTAVLSVRHECVSEIEALEKEAAEIETSLGDGECLNTVVPTLPSKLYWVYVIQSEQPRFGARGQELPGFFYVGMAVDPSVRLRKHNGIKANGQPGLKGGGKYTAKHRPWVARALYGPYFTRSEALRAEYALKRQKRGEGRLKWSSKDSDLCRGEGPSHPWVRDPSWKPPTLDEWRAGSVDPT